MTVEHNSSELIGQNYEDVSKKLRNSGFHNLHRHIEDDLSIEEAELEYLVTDIKIGKKNGSSLILLPIFSILRWGQRVISGPFQLLWKWNCSGRNGIVMVVLFD